MMTSVFSLAWNDTTWSAVCVFQQDEVAEAVKMTTTKIASLDEPDGVPSDDDYDNTSDALQHIAFSAETCDNPV